VTEGWTRRDATADCDNTTGTDDVTDGCCAMSCTPEPGWIAVGTACDGLPTTLITLLADMLVVTGTAETGCNHILHDISIESNHTYLNFVLKYLVLLYYTIYFHFHFRAGQSMRPHRLKPQSEQFRHPLKQLKTYGNFRDFLTNHIISLIVGQSKSVRCKLGFPHVAVLYYTILSVDI